MLDLTNETIETKTNSRTLPKGRYKVVLDSAQLQETKAGDGKYIKCTFRVLDAPYENRMLFDNFNVENKNPEAVKIARQMLAQLMKAHGLPTEKWKINSPGELEGMSAYAEVGIKSDSYGDRNVIYGFSASPQPTSSSSKITRSEDPDALPF